MDSKDSIKLESVRFNHKYVYNRGRQLEGTYPEDSSAWGITAMRVQFGWGMVNYQAWPDDSLPNFVEPPGMDDAAKPHRIGGYRRIRNSIDCIEAFKLGLPVVVCVEITGQWYYASLGVIQDIPDQITPRDAHCVTILGYVKETEHFVFLNSWGQEWGKGGYGLFSTAYFDKWSIDCWTLLDVTWRNEPRYSSGLTEEGRLYSVDDKDYIVAMLTDHSADERIGWIICTARGGYFDIEELDVRPQFRRQGFGRHLADMAVEIANRNGWPIRLWVSYADCYDENQANILSVAKWLGLIINKSQATWAGYVGVPGKPPKYLPSIRIPTRPKAVRDQEAKHETSLVTQITAGDEMKMWARKARRARIRQDAEGDE